MHDGCRVSSFGTPRKNIPEIIRRNLEFAQHNAYANQLKVPVSTASPMVGNTDSGFSTKSIGDKNNEPN